MSTETYELLAQGASIWFVILAVIIVFKSWKNSLDDNRAERDLRAWSGESGCVGEFVVLDDGVRNIKRSIKGKRLQIPGEGLIGTSRVADIRISHSDVRRKHIRYTYQGGELHLKLCKNANAECPASPDGTLVLRDGDRLIIGKLVLLTVFYSLDAAAAAGGRTAVQNNSDDEEYDDPFEERFWE